MTGTIDVSPAIAPHGLRVDDKGRLYAVCDLSRKLLVIDPKARKVQASIDIERHWTLAGRAARRQQGLHRQQAGSSLFVSVIDLKARKMAGRGGDAERHTGIGMSLDGSRGGGRLRRTEHPRDRHRHRQDRRRRSNSIESRAAARSACSTRRTARRLVTTTIGSNRGCTSSTRRTCAGKQLVVPVGRDPFGVAFANASETALMA